MFSVKIKDLIRILYTLKYICIYFIGKETLSFPCFSSNIVYAVTLFYKKSNANISVEISLLILMGIVLCSTVCIGTLDCLQKSKVE